MTSIWGIKADLVGSMFWKLLPGYRPAMVRISGLAARNMSKSIYEIRCRR